MHIVKRRIKEGWHSISQYVGKEVFIVVGSEDEEAGDIGVFETWGELVEQLKTLTPTSDPETRIFHGILTTGEFLPSSFHGKSVFIIYIDPYEDAKGNIVESTSGSSRVLAEEIGSIMTLGGPMSDMKIDIDDIYVLYGYQLETCLSVNDEDVDEEVIATCKEIAVEIEVARIIVENV
jgi:hypothetical protein